MRAAQASPTADIPVPETVSTLIPSALILIAALGKRLARRMLSQANRVIQLNSVILRKKRPQFLELTLG